MLKYPSKKLCFILRIVCLRNKQLYRKGYNRRMNNMEYTFDSCEEIFQTKQGLLSIKKL